MAKKVVMVEVVEEDESGQRIVKRLVNEEADVFIKAVESFGVKAYWEVVF